MAIGVGDYAQVLLNGNWDGSGALSEPYTQLCGGWWTFSIVPADTNCIRNLLKFDDMLVMMSAPALNNGIMGYRAGQNIEDTTDFIELL